ncbi:MAG: CCA tRNA nucleotidyltransferase, partial [Desulfuromonadales bacterium]|nr:CCA tRNA nucleotidyltransferase [Desulfuromonadales bacterium]
RDFTINTLAVSLNGPHYGELLDFFGAQRDLKDRAVRILHNLSFVEDPTRVFRAIRFEQRLGFHLGKHTELLLRSAVRMGFLERVGGRRVLNELIIIFREADPLPALLRMADLDLLKFFHPALAITPRLRSLFEAANRIVHWYELLSTAEPCERWFPYFLCLVADLDRDAVLGLAQRLELPSRYLPALEEEREEAQRVVNLLERRRARHSPPRNSDLFRRLDPLSTEALLYLMAKAGSDEVRRWVSHYFTHLRGETPLLTGSDLKALGLPPGPLYRKILQVLRDARLNGRVATRDEELALVRRRFLSSALPESGK